MNNIIVTILGKSGTGKSTSIKNLDKESTLVISTDGKQLPFKGANGFKVRTVNGNEPDKMLTLLEQLKDEKNNHIKTVVIDAFTQFGETLMFECNNKFRGFDRQNAYNNKIFEFFEKIKDLHDKVVYIFAHPVIGETYEGEDVVVAKVDNKQRKGIVEERSLILLMTRVIKTEDGIKYVFETEPTEKTPTKAPEGMFETSTIPNDLDLVNKAIEKYYE